MYEIQVNGESVWTSEESLGADSEHLVTEISIQTPRGEATMVRVPPEERVLNIVIQPRSLELLPLDLVEESARRAKAERFEVGHDEDESNDVTDIESKFELDANGVTDQFQQ